ncbi:Ras family protein [Entamoeba marina]
MDCIEVNQIVEECDILYNIYTCFVGDPSNSDDRKTLLWNCYTQMTFKIQNRIGRIHLQNYDNFISRNSSYLPFKNVTLAVVVFDFQDESYKNIKNWHGEVQRFCGNPTNLQTLVVGVYQDDSYLNQVPEHIQNIINIIPNSTFYYYSPNTASGFRAAFLSKISEIRQLVYPDTKLDAALEKKQKLNDRKSRIASQRQQSAQHAKVSTRVSSRTTAPINNKRISTTTSNKKFNLVTRNKNNLFVQIKCITLGDPSISLSLHQVVQHTLNLPAALGEDLFEYPQQLVSKENGTIRLRMEVYNHSIPNGKSYTPYFNALVGIIIFHYDNKESFKNVVNWFQETQRYSNLPTMHYFVVGRESSENEPVVGDVDVDNLINYIGKQKEIEFFKCNDNNWDELVIAFYDFLDKVYNIEFPSEFLSQCLTALNIKQTNLTREPINVERPHQHNAFVMDDENAIGDDADETGSLLGGRTKHEEMEYEDYSSGCCCTIL